MGYRAKTLLAKDHNCRAKRRSALRYIPLHTGCLQGIRLQAADRTHDKRLGDERAHLNEKFRYYKPNACTHAHGRKEGRYVTSNSLDLQLFFLLINKINSRNVFVVSLICRWRVESDSLPSL